jgi:hypothetical protein
MAQARHRHGDLRRRGFHPEARLMVAKPLIEETSGSPAGAVLSGLAGLRDGSLPPEREETIEGRQLPRRLSIYQAAAGFSLVEEFDYLCARTIEPNLFFNPRFLAPAMPRLEDREVRLAVIASTMAGLLNSHDVPSSLHGLAPQPVQYVARFSQVL